MNQIFMSVYSKYLHTNKQPISNHYGPFYKM